MKPDKEQFRCAPPHFGSGGDIGSQAAQLLKLLLVTGIELGAFVLHYAAYTQTMTLMPGGYLVDIPGIGWAFEAAPDMQVNHLVASALALASVATPVVGFFYLIRNRVIDDPGAFLSNMPNRVLLIALLLFWSLMVGVEIYNVLTLIDSYVRNPFTKNSAADVLLQHEGLAFLSAVVIAMVNTAIALGTAVVWVGILGRKELRS